MIGAPLRDQIDELPIYGHANGPAVQRLRQHRIYNFVEAHLGFTAPLCLCLRLIPLWPKLVKRLPTIAAFNAHASEWILRKRVIQLCESAVRLTRWNSMAGTAVLDPIDRLILRTLQEDGRTTNVALSEKVGLTAPP